MNETLVNTSDLSWEEAKGYPDGVMRKVFRRDSNGKPLTLLLKIPPQFEMEGHSHVCVEQHYILEGEYESAGKQYRAGDYRMIPKYADHGPFRSDTGAVILVAWELCEPESK